MRKILMIISLILVLAPCALAAGPRMVFFHRSTGQNLMTDGGNWYTYLEALNSANSTSVNLWHHNTSGGAVYNPAGSSTGLSWPVPAENTQPLGLWHIWNDASGTGKAYRDTLTSRFDVIVMKSCYEPPNIIDSEGELTTWKNYMLDNRDVWDTYPDITFVVMTPPPHSMSTPTTYPGSWWTPEKGGWDRDYANFLKSSEFLSGHPNVKCFDFFDLLAEPDDDPTWPNALAQEYIRGVGDNHPSASANVAIRPQLLDFLYAIATGTEELTVSGSSGIYDDGETVTIYGLGFGTKDPAPPAFWDTYETMAEGAAPSRYTPDIGEYMRWHAGLGNVVQTANSYNGSKSLVVNVNSSFYQPGIGANLNHGTGDQSMAYVNMKVVMADNTGWTAGNNKFLRLNPGQRNLENGDLEGLPYIGAGEANFRGAPNLAFNNNRGSTVMDQVQVNFGYWDGFPDPHLGRPIAMDGGWIWPGGPTTWVSVQAYAKLSSSVTYWEDPADGFAGYEIDDNKAFADSINTWNYSETCTRYPVSGPAGYYCVVMMDYGDGAGGTVYWVDNLYADNSISRVVIGNAPTYSACTNYDPQPPTSWTLTQIEVTFNRGAYTNGNTAWVYVVDADGNHNEDGHAITIAGSDEPPNTGAPGAPTNLTATEN